MRYFKLISHFSKTTEQQVNVFILLLKTKWFTTVNYCTIEFVPIASPYVRIFARVHYSVKPIQRGKFIVRRKTRAHA
jgi:hypothetical protein